MYSLISFRVYKNRVCPLHAYCRLNIRNTGVGQKDLYMLEKCIYICLEKFNQINSPLHYIMSCRDIVNQ
jgi:hypothetical protein